MSLHAFENSFGGRLLMVEPNRRHLTRAKGQFSRETQKVEPGFMSIFEHRGSARTMREIEYKDKSHYNSVMWAFTYDICMGEFASKSRKFVTNRDNLIGIFSPVCQLFDAEVVGGLNVKGFQCVNALN